MGEVQDHVDQHLHAPGLQVERREPGEVVADRRQGVPHFLHAASREPFAEPRRHPAGDDVVAVMGGVGCPGGRDVGPGRQADGEGRLRQTGLAHFNQRHQGEVPAGAVADQHEPLGRHLLQHPAHRGEGIVALRGVRVFRGEPVVEAEQPRPGRLGEEGREIIGHPGVEGVAAAVEIEERRRAGHLRRGHPETRRCAGTCRGPGELRLETGAGLHRVEQAPPLGDVHGHRAGEPVTPEPDADLVDRAPARVEAAAGQVADRGGDREPHERGIARNPVAPGAGKGHLGHGFSFATVIHGLPAAGPAPGIEGLRHGAARPADPAAARTVGLPLRGAAARHPGSRALGAGALQPFSRLAAGDRHLGLSRGAAPG